ncbi:MAG TPA: BatA domain-containing protein [Luteimonas sp.]|nr:BatA domain-containing protein [Luteimonas sp.]
MNPVLLLPMGLAALAALSLPLLIHLARRQQQRPTVFAALRWLRARPKPRRRIRFDERWLLALRLLLLALLAVLLARPALLDVVDAHPRVLVVPGVDASAVAALRSDRELDARWLAPGFPPLDEAAPAGAAATASLLREFDAALAPAASLAVLVPERMTGADAARLQLSRAADWRIVAGGAWPEPAVDAAPALAIRHDESHREGARHLRAAALAWQDGDGAQVDVAESADLPAKEDVALAWLHPGALPHDVLRRVEQGGDVLLAVDGQLPDGVEPTVAWRDAGGEPLLHVARVGRGRLLQLARSLTPAAMPELLDPSFPHALRDRLQPAPVPTAVAAMDYAPHSGAAAPVPSPLDLRPWLALAIALLFLLERWLATSRRRGAVA